MNELNVIDVTAAEQVLGKRYCSAKEASVYCGRGDDPRSVRKFIEDAVEPFMVYKRTGGQKLLIYVPSIDSGIDLAEGLGTMEMDALRTREMMKRIERKSAYC